MNTTQRRKAPKNRNPFDSNRFTFSVLKLPAVDFQVTSVSLPGLNLGSVSRPNPFNPYPMPGDLKWQNLRISFQIDENFESWKEIFTWMIALGRPQNFEQYRELMQDSNFQHVPTDKNIYSDAILTVYSSHWNPVVKYKFRDMWPESLDSVPMDSQITDTTNVILNTTFAYRDYVISY